VSHTHYWHTQRKFTPKAFKELTAMVQIICTRAKSAPFLLGSTLEVNKEYILMNGAPLSVEENEPAGSDDEYAHEDFYFKHTSVEFDFCKTNQKPYDTLVVACLIAAEVIVVESGSSIEFTTDAYLAELDEGIALFECCYPSRLAQTIVCVSGDRLLPKTT
jgi:hypothetical protein